MIKKRTKVGVLNAGLSAGPAILWLWLSHVQPMIMILTSDPTKRNQVRVLWAQEGGVMDVFICTEDPCLRWVTDLNFSWHRMDDGGVRSEEGSLSSRFIFLLSSRTAYSPRVDHLDLYWGVKTPRWRAGSYSNTGWILRWNNASPTILYHSQSGGKQSPGVPTPQRSGVRLTLTHARRAAGKQPVDRTSSLSNTDKTMTSESWPPSQQIPLPPTPQRETRTNTHTRTFALMLLSFVT